MERGYRKQQQLNVKYVVDDTTFTFSGPELLGALDLRVFQALIAAATTERHTHKGIKPLFRNAKSIAPGLKATGKAVRHVIAIPISLAQIANSVGYKTPSGATFQRIRDVLQRLHKTELTFKKNDILSSTRIISELQKSPSTGEQFICLNCYSSSAILQQKNYLRIDLEETRNINSDPCRILHQRLHWINKGTTKKVSLNTVCGYIYGENQEVTPSAASRRKKTAITALEEIEKQLHWQIRLIKANIFEISRPN